MAIWEKAKDASVDARRRDEEYHARAMYEIKAGKRRDGLWAKSVTSAVGDEGDAKLVYFKLLVQALQDDDHIAMRASQSQAASPQECSIPQKNPPSPAAPKPGLLRRIWLWCLVVLATLVLVFGFVPLVIDGRAGTLSISHWLIAGFWVVVIQYALKKLFPGAKS